MSFTSSSNSHHRGSESTTHHISQPLDEIFRNFVNLLKRHKFIVLIPVILAESMALYHYYVNRTYTATSKLIIQKADNSSLQSISVDLGASKSQLLNYNFAKDNYLETILLYLNTQDSFEEIAKDLLETVPGQNIFYEMKRAAQTNKSLFRTLRPPPPPKNIPNEKNDVGTFASMLRGATRYEKGPISGFYVSAETQAPALSTAIARAMAEKSQQLITRRDLKQLGEGKNYITTKLDELTDSLNEIEKEMLSIRKKSNGPISSQKNLVQNLSNYQSIQNDLEENKIKLDQNERLIKSITSQLQKNQSSSTHQDPASIAILKRQSAALEARRKRLISEGMSENSPQVLALAEEIKTTLKQLPKNKRFDKELSSEEPLGFLEDNINPELRISDLRKENWLLRSRIKAASKLLLTEKLSKTSLPEDEQKYYALNKRLEMRYLLFAELSKQLFNIDVSRISIQNRVINIETASMSSVFRKPTLFPLIPMAFILALILGALIATIVEKYDPTIVTSKDFPVFNYVSLGNVPMITEAKMISPHLKDNRLKSLIFRHRLDLPQTVPFKRVRTRLMHLERTLSQRPQVISIHSTHSGDGKSFVCGNMAASVAASNKKTLLMDLDLRKKAISKELAARDAKGVTTYLSDPKITDYRQFIIPEIQPCLDVFPSGPATHHSTELLNSAKFSQLLQQLRGAYDHILIDNAPFLALPDSEIVASQSDVIVMVASCHKTKVNDLLTMLDHFLQFGEKTVCLILNRTTGKSQLYYYYYGVDESKTRNKVA